MVSISTSNTGVASAALRSINAQLAVTQNRIATGLKVASASDNASVWATATKIRSDDSVASSVKSGISTAKAQVDAALSALDSVSDIFAKMSEISAAASAAGGGTDAQKNEIAGLQLAAKAIINGAKVDGKNVLLGDDLSVVLNANDGAANSDATLTVTGAKVLDTTSGIFKDTLGATVATADIAAFSAKVTSAVTALGETAATLSSQAATFDTSMSFLDKLSDIRQAAVGGLVDADLEKETAKMQALQVRQQLAYQALSMANSSAQNVLMLFR